MEYAYKFQIYPNNSQKELISKTFGCVRFVYNYFLNQRIEYYQQHNKSLSFYDCNKLLTQLKCDKLFLKEVDKFTLQNAFLFKKYIVISIVRILNLSNETISFKI